MLKPEQVQNKSGPGKAPLLYRCPRCQRTGTLVLDRRQGKVTEAVSGCACLDPPEPEEIKPCSPKS